MRKQEAKDIALLLIAKSGENFDIFAFDDCELSKDDEDKIIKQIQSECQKTIQKLSKKYNVNFGTLGETKEIVENVLFEL